MVKPIKLSKWSSGKFIPNSDKLMCISSRQIDVFDLTLNKFIAKVVPGVSCIEDSCFASKNERLVLLGGCVYGNSEIFVLRSDTFEVVNKIIIPEEVRAIASDPLDDSITFGTHSGNVYSVGVCDEVKLDEKIVKIDRKSYKEYSVSPDNDIKIMEFEEAMISSVAVDDRTDDMFFAVTYTENCHDLSLKRQGAMIVKYNRSTKAKEKIGIPYLSRSEQISCMKIWNGFLAVMVSKYKPLENGGGVYDAVLYVVDCKDYKIVYTKSGFEIGSAHSKVDAISWNSKGLLAYIKVDSVVVLDLENAGNELEIPFDNPFSVQLSECGKRIAIGGEKSVLVSIA